MKYAQSSPVKLSKGGNVKAQTSLKSSLIPIRTLSLILNFFMILATFSLIGVENLGLTILYAIGIGLVCAISLFGLERLTLRLSLRSLNFSILGLLIGFLLAKSMILPLDFILEGNELVRSSFPYAILKGAITLFSIYLAVILLNRASEDFVLSIPFIKLQAEQSKTKDLILDTSVLKDSRIVDLASTGLLDKLLVVPRYILKDLCAQLEEDNEVVSQKAKRALEVLRKLETLDHLHLRFNEMDFNEIKDPQAKMIHLARFLNANILTCQVDSIQQSSIEGVRFINLNHLSQALKPMTQTGEFLEIKVQRSGKEPSQGIGYLEDGTMVVINGGGEYIMQTIKTQVLSVKRTTTGRIIFCNALEFIEDSMETQPSAAEMAAQTYSAR